MTGHVKWYREDEWPVGTDGLGRLRIVQEWAFLSGEELGCGTVHRGLTCSGYWGAWIGSLGCSLCHNHVGYEGCDVQVRYNKPQSEYLEHILCNQHEYGTMNNLMTQLKPLNNLNMLTSTNNSTSKQFTRKGSLFQNNTQANRNLRYNWPFTPPPIPLTWQGHLCSFPLPGLLACCPAPHSPTTSNKGMYRVSYSSQ